jgi:phage terminase large subunit GpA-like protein
MKGAQLGGTECGNNWIGYVVHHAPGPMLAVQPTVELAKRFSQQRIDPLIEEFPALRERVAPARSRDSGNTVLSKEFPAGILVMTGANSAVGLRSMPARYLVKGADGFDRSAPVTGLTWVEASEGAKKVKRGARLWRVSVAVFKSETCRQLRLDRPTVEEAEAGATHPAGYIHLPGAIDTEWCKQLVAEQLVTVKTKRGFTRLEWQKLRERNEALDCRVYALRGMGCGRRSLERGALARSRSTGRTSRRRDDRASG